MWRERVTAERAELEKKLADLLAFICGGAHVLGAAERKLLRRQARAMAAYSAVLAERLAAKDGVPACLKCGGKVADCPYLPQHCPAGVEGRKP